MADRLVDRELDRLFGLPLRDFVAARQATVRRLRQEGHRDEAAEVAKARKPSAAAGVTNALSRRDPRVVRAVVDAGAAARAAIETGAERATTTEALARQASALAEAMRLATEIGRELEASATVLERVRETLMAAALDATIGRDVTGGRLVRERRVIGLGPLPPPRPATASPEQAGPTPGSPDGQRSTPTRTDTARARRQAQRRELEERRDELDAAIATLRDVDEAAAKTLEDVRRLRGRLERERTDVMTRLQRSGSDR